MLNHHQLENSFDKTLKVIQSCTTEKHLESALKMVNNFKILYKKVGSVSFLYYKLDKELAKQRRLCR